MATPNISVRRYIRWIPGDPHEPTSTLVLTSSAGKFVDIRILNSEQHRNIGFHEHESPDLPLSRLEWGFAGTTVREPAHEKDGKPTHAKWYHAVDSKARLDAEPPMDEGDMYAQENGEELEKGNMVNPATGKLTDYEEMWYDVEIEHFENPRDLKVCVVLTYEGTSGLARGIIVRIGQWCQGILKQDETLRVERWKFVDGTWRAMARFGKGFLPCEATFDPDKLIAGNKLGSDWFVDEVTRW